MERQHHPWNEGSGVSAANAVALVNSMAAKSIPESRTFGFSLSRLRMPTWDAAFLFPVNQKGADRIRLPTKMHGFIAPAAFLTTF